MKRLLLFVGLSAPVGSTLAVDGVIEINHARALAGGITPGDEPGYPVTLNQSGSYRLTGNLTLPNKDTTGVTAFGNDIVLDLNGFAIKGPNLCTISPDGLTCGQNGLGIGVQLQGSRGAVRNGIVSGTGSDGVKVHNYTSVEHLQVPHVGGNGIDATGEGNIIRDTTIGYARNHGINMGDLGIVSGNAVVRAGNVGIYNATGANLLVSGNTVLSYGDALYCGNQMAYAGNVLDSSVGAPANANCTGYDAGGNKAF